MSVKSRLAATVEQPQEPDARPRRSIPGGATRATTAPGLMMAFMPSLERKEEELDRKKEELDESNRKLAVSEDALQLATERLREFDDAEPTKLLNPALVARSKWANRSEDEFQTREYEQLKAEIEAAGVNVQPIKVRAIRRERPPETAVEGGVFAGRTPSAPEYEIVFGHRRHRACSDLGIQVRAIVTTELTDLAMFEEMDRENRSRKDLSIFEQGAMYAGALSEGLYPSLRRLASALGVALGQASEAVQIAQLPTPILEAFKSPLDLQRRWSKPLADALARDGDKVISRALEARSQRGNLTAQAVFELLVGKSPASQAKTTEIKAGAEKLATFRANSNGHTVLEFTSALPAEKQAALSSFIRELMR